MWGPVLRVSDDGQAASVDASLTACWRGSVPPWKRHRHLFGTVQLLGPLVSPVLMMGQ